MTGRQLPPAGWSGPDRRGHVMFTVHGSSSMVRPPSKEGFECYWVAVVGVDYTRWTYRPKVVAE